MTDHTQEPYSPLRIHCTATNEQVLIEVLLVQSFISQYQGISYSRANLDFEDTILILVYLELIIHDQLLKELSHYFNIHLREFRKYIRATNSCMSPYLCRSPPYAKPLRFHLNQKLLACITKDIWAT